MKNMTIVAIVGISCLAAGILLGRSLRANDYMHGHTDGLLAGIFEEYTRGVHMDTSQMDAGALANHNLHLDFLEKRVEDVFTTATVPYSPELKENWSTELKPLRKAKLNPASQPIAAKRGSG